MNCCRFDPDSTLARLKENNSPPRLLSLDTSILVGALGFGGVSTTVFLVWAVAGGALGRSLGEGGFYAVCAALFIGLSGWVLEGLLVERGRLTAFYGLFTGAFGLYAVGWCAAWFTLVKPLNATGAGWVGALAGTLLMAAVLGAAFGARGRLLAVFTVLFACNASGYFLGDYFYAFLKTPRAAQLIGELDPATRATAAKLLWGAAYGLGFGAGIGFALHLCQKGIRERLTAARP
jgi:hypothetical protein